VRSTGVNNGVVAKGLMLSLAGLACGLAGCGSRDAETTAAAEPSLTFAEEDGLIDQYCLGCHNYDDNAGGLALLLFEGENAHADPEIAEAMIRKLRSGQMPPEGEPRPDFETEQALAAGIEAVVDAHADYKPGWRGLDRLNRTEYQNVVHDLLGLDIDAADFLPVDDSSNGFDNQAGSLGLSPALLQAYLSAAGDLSRLAMGDVTEPSQAVYRVPADRTQNYHIEGLPFDTRGGILIEHAFPVDAEYNFKILPVTVGNMGQDRAFGGVRGEQLEVLIDGERVALIDWDDAFPNGAKAGTDVRVAVSAGEHEVGVTFLASNFAPLLDLNNAFDRSTIETGGLPGFTFYPHVGVVRIDGPYDPAGAEDSPSRRKILVCEPAEASQESACADQVIATLARRAYRGAQTGDDIATLRAFYDQARAEGGDFDDGIQAALQRLLADPKFIYRIENPPQGVAPGETYAISDLELASRLSFFLWSSMPDDTLLDAAEEGRLHEPDELERQVRRMIADPRSYALAQNFAGQWLAIRNLDGHVPVTDEFPDFDDNLRQAFATEMELFFDSIIREDRSAIDLLTADYTFVNGRLAEHYGIPGVKGSRFRRVELTDEFDARRGLLGKGGLLTVTAKPTGTAPVIRGNWILTNVLGAPAPPPPPKVPAFNPVAADAAGNTRPATMREQFEQHRSDPACAGCHKMMDPIGFALEPFDATGRFRTTDAAGNPIDAADVMYDGTHVNGPADLRNFMLKYRVRFLQNTAAKLLTYAVGRGMETEDMPIVRKVVHDAAADDYRFQSLILAVVNSEPFLKNTAPGADEVAGAATDETRFASAGGR
jgi:hypothetical protein